MPLFFVLNGLSAAEGYKMVRFKPEEDARKVMTVIHIMFSSSSVILKKEVKVFSFQSLVADVGGVLGLFIGFSFLGLSEFAIAWIKKFYEHCRKF